MQIIHKRNESGHYVSNQELNSLKNLVEFKENGPRYPDATEEEKRTPATVPFVIDTFKQELDIFRREQGK